MDSLVSYGSDDDGSDIYQEIKDPILRGMDRLGRQGDEDTNYDNVQMDMSEESNNNNSSYESSSDDDKSSAKSSVSASTVSSIVSSEEERRRQRSPHEERSTLELMNRRVTPPLLKSSKGEKYDSKKQSPPKIDDRARNERDKERRKERRNSRERDGADRRDKERSRYVDRHVKEGASRVVQPSKIVIRDHRSKSNSKDIDTRRIGRVSPDRKRRSRSPLPRHGSSAVLSSHVKHSDLLRGGNSRSSREKDRGRSRSRSRDRQKSKSRERQRSRSRDRQRSRSRERQRSRSRERSGKDNHRRRGYEKKLTILERLGIELRPPEVAPPVTPQQLLQRSIEAQVQQVKSNTGIELPKYYNPAAMNPARYAEQMQKRRLLWGSKTAPSESPTEGVKPVVVPQTSNNKWEGTTFAQDQDGKMTAKFKRLMGIKETAQGGSGASSAPNTEGNDILKKQEELFNSMEMQYEVARVATHTHRGLGLGFGTFQYPR